MHGGAERQRGVEGRRPGLGGGGAGPLGVPANPEAMDYRGGWRAAPLRGGSRLGPARRRGRHRRGAACERALYALAAAMGTVGVALLVTIGRQQPALTASLLEERQRVGRTGAAVRPEGPLLNAALQEVEEALDTLDATPADGDDWVYEDPSAEKEVGATAEGEPAAEDGEAEDADYEERPLVPRDSEAAAEDASDPGVRARGAQQPKKAPAPPPSRDLFPFIRLGDTNAALFNKSVGANADGKTLAFWHIPKTGGTYVENVLSGAGIKVGRDLFEAAGDRKTVRPAMPKAFSPWHMPLPEMLEYIETSAMKWAEPPVEGNTLRWWLDLDNVDFFCVVRDPYWKLISEYKWRTSIATADDHGHKLDCSVGSLNRFLAKWVPSGKHFDHHMTPQVRFIYDSNGDQVCRHILRQENLNAQLHALLLEYNLIDAAAAVPSHAAEAQTAGNRDQAAKGALLGADAHQRGGGRGLANAQARENDMKSGDCGFDPSMLAEETKRLIRERYREDFEAFGYDDLSEDDLAEGDPAEDPSLQPGPLPTFWFSQENDELANATGGAFPAAPGPSPCVPGAYAVLISGQVQRFVWQDEAGPLVAAADPACPPEVDVYIVLQQGEMGRVWSGAVPDAPYQAETTAENLRDWYRTRGARHVWVEFVSGADVRAFLDEAPFPKGKPGWRHSPESNFSGARYRNNLKMFYLRHLAFAAASASDRFYDGFTYWREDNFFYTPLPEALIPSAGPKPEVAVDANCGWWSYSDKVYATNPAGAGVLFDLTLDDFLAKMADYAAYGASGGEWTDRGVPDRRHGRRWRDRDEAGVPSHRVGPSGGRRPRRIGVGDEVGDASGNLSTRRGPTLCLWEPGPDRSGSPLAPLNSGSALAGAREEGGVGTA